MSRSTDVLIVGGGVIGCSIAYHLSKANVDCLVVDQGEIGAQASSAALGVLVPLVSFDNDDFIPLLLASFRLFPTLVPELEAVSGIQVEYQQTGALHMVSQPKQIKKLQQQMQMWQRWNFDVQWLTHDEIQTREPQLSEHVCAAVVAPQEAQINAPLLVQAFAKAAQNNKACFLPQSKVVGISRQGSMVTSVSLSTGEVISCNQLVLAAGAWSGMWEQWLGISLPVYPVKGQAIALQQPSHAIKHILFGEGIYIAPKNEHLVFIGATKDNAGFDTTVTQEGIAWLRAAAHRLVPALSSGVLKSAKAGLRPKTPDSKPILGRIEQLTNVFVATGHNAFGVQLSPITGLCVAELIMTRQPPALMRPFLPSRFQHNL